MSSKDTTARSAPSKVLSGIAGAGVSAESVHARATALTSALESGLGCLPVAGVEQAASAIAKTAARTSIAGGRTVVALAGATGSGKSSLFNVLAGAEVAQVGARRPTTSKPGAAIWGSESPTALLDWLKVGTRHMVDEGPSELTAARAGPSSEPVADPTQQPAATPAPGPTPTGSSDGPDLGGLVLLDLPDFDSQASAHRVEADRVLEQVDVFIWVTDPQKYADARLHEDYIAKLSAHDAVTLTVLNQADRLTPEALAACRRDLVRLLTADGLLDPEVIATSARDLGGVDDLLHRLGAVVGGQHAAVQRLDSDLRSAATDLRPSVADSEPGLGGSADTSLVDALSRAAGIPVILDAVERDFRRETAIVTGWPITRWARALRPDPLKRLGLKKDQTGHSSGISQSDVRSVLGRSSLPPATPAARSAVALTTRELGDRAGRELPQAWTDAVTDAAMPPGADLGDALDQAVMGTSLRARDPFWWTLFGFLQFFLAMTAAVGLSWLIVLMVLGWLRLPAVETPTLGPLPYPSLLFVGALLVGYLISLMTGAMGRVAARRRKALVTGRLRESLEQVARDRLIAPVQDVLDRHRMTREHLDQARTATPAPANLGTVSGSHQPNGRSHLGTART
jgi:energy-coupling factor transporter ATP-binding protein EcfA2